MRDDELDRRLAAASDRLAGLGGALRTGEPWAFAVRFDHSPESSWGPRETLAHLEEMLPYWLGEAERIVDSTGGPPDIGRVATDDVRLATIERDRTLPLRELVDRIQADIERWRRRWAELDEASRQREGTHPTAGRMTVADVADRFAVGHLEAHLDQLAVALGSDLTPG